MKNSKLLEINIFVTPMGFEPTTHRLRGESSTIELRSLPCTPKWIRTTSHAYALSGWSRLVTPMSGCV